MFHNKNVFSQNGSRLVHWQHGHGQNEGFSDGLSPFGYANLNHAQEPLHQQRGGRSSEDHLDCFIQEYNGYWQPQAENPLDVMLPLQGQRQWRFLDFDSLMPMALVARAPPVQAYSPPEVVPAEAHFPVRPIVSQSSEESFQEEKPEKAKLGKQREKEFKLSQQMSVKSVHPNKTKEKERERPAGKEAEKAPVNLPDPNFLLTMKLVDPTFDLGEFMRNFGQTGRDKGLDYSQELESLSGLKERQRGAFKSIFENQNFVLQNIERELKSIRGEREKEERQAVFERIKELERDLRRQEKDKTFEKFKEELFEVN